MDKGDRPPKELKLGPSTRKDMPSVFWYALGFLFSFGKGRTIIKDWYFDYLDNLRLSIDGKQPRTKKKSLSPRQCIASLIDTNSQKNHSINIYFFFMPQITPDLFQNVSAPQLKILLAWTRFQLNEEFKGEKVVSFQEFRKLHLKLTNNTLRSFNPMLRMIIQRSC